MTPYFIMYSIVIVNTIINYRKQKYMIGSNKMSSLYKLKQHITSYEFTLLLLFLFAALRGNGNGDYYNYISGVKYVDSLSFLFNPVDYPFEFGFRLLSYISNTLNLNPQFVIFSMNAISFTMINKAIKKQSKNRYFSLFLFYPIMLLFDMHHSRSAVAISAGILFFTSIKDSEWYKAIFYFLIGFLFHKSAIVMFLFIFVRPISLFIERSKMLNFRKLSYYLIIILIVISLFINPLTIMIKIFDNPLSFGIYKKLNSYLNNERWSYTFSLFDPRLILNIYIYIFMVSYKNVDENGRSFQIIQLLSVISMLFLRHSTILVMRVYNFFNIFTIISIPYFLTREVNDFEIKTIIDFSKKIIIFAYLIYTLALISRQVDYKIFMLT